MSTVNNVFLIGPMGAGKTTIGKQLARIIGMDFYDIDSAIEESCGASIDWIFDIEGEAGFRDREAKMIEELTQKRGIILATGGGSVLSEENRTYLASRGCVIYLKATIEQQLERTVKDTRRPLLQTGNKQAVLEEMREVREPLYDEIADFTISTNTKSIRAVVANIVDYIESLD